MSEMLLSILDETLNAVVEQMRVVEAVIAGRRDDIREAQQAIRAAEDQLKCAVYEDEQALKKIDVLRTYLARLGKPPQILMAKARDLGEAQGRTKEARRATTERVALAKNNLQGRQTQLAVVEQEYADLQKQWNEISELVSQERANANA